MTLPDFNQIARQLAFDGSESGIVDDEHVQDITEQLLLVWNARGAADIDAADDLAHFTQMTVAHAIRELDR